MKKFAIASALTAISANAAFAKDGFGNQPVAVPEISALEGTAALAAIAAIVLLAWERRRRAS